jgi:hypothetical protein
MAGRLGNGQAVCDRLVRVVDLKKVFLLGIVAALLASQPASAQIFGDRPMRYGITSNFFNYDNRVDQRDFPTNGVFPGNFATSPFFASIGAAGWLGSNPQHQAQPYPSQSYFVVDGGRISCPPRGHAAAAADAGPAKTRPPRHILCLAP